MICAETADLRSVLGGGRFLSNLEPAAGVGFYNQSPVHMIKSHGCEPPVVAHTSWGRWVAERIRMLPCLEQVLRLLQKSLSQRAVHRISLIPCLWACSISGPSMSSDRAQRTRICRGSWMFLLASNSDRIYRACPRQRCLWTAQSSESLRERR